MTYRRPQMRTWIAGATVAALAAAGVLAGCGSSGNGSGGGKVTITFWDDNGGPERTPIYRHLIAQFERQNPGISVTYVGVPEASVQQKYDTAVAGGAPPDVGGVTTSFLSDLVGQGALVPLDEDLSASSLNGKLVKNFVTAVRQTAPDGKLYEIPAAANLDVLWYRADWLRQAGLTAPKTWDQFLSDAQKLTGSAKNRYGYTIRGGSGAIFQLLAEMYSYSGISSFFDSSGKSTIDDPRNIAAIKQIAALYGKDTPKADVDNGYPQMVAEFDGGAVAMMHHNLGSYTDHVKAFGAANVAAVPLPMGSAGHYTVVNNPVDGFAIFKSSPHQAADWKFVQFLVSEQSNSYWNQQVGEIPANTGVASAAWIQQEAPVKMASEVLSDPATTTVEPPYYLPQFSSITKTDMEPLYQKVLLGQMSAAAFAQKFAQEMTAAQQDWRSHHH
jgi:multiple sugar transport system substrate-binding protein